MGSVSSSLLYYGKEHCSLKSSLPNNDSDLLNFLMKSAFCFSFLPTVVLTSNGRKFLSGSEGRFDLEKNFTTGLLTRFHYFVCSELTHFLFYSFFLLETIPSSFWLISEWPRWFKCGVVVVFFFLQFEPFWKSLLNLLQCCFCFMFSFFGHKAGGILASEPRIEPIPLHWNVES